MQDLTESTPIQDVFGNYDSHKEVMCIFRCTPRGFPRTNLLAHTGGGQIFQKKSTTMASVLFEETQRFFFKAITNPSVSYILLFTRKKIPLLVVTKTAPVSGVYVGFELRADSKTTVSFLKTMPNISVLIDPIIDEMPSQQQSDPVDFARLSVTFRRVFSIFETGEYIQRRSSDPFPVFKLFKMRVNSVAEAFGISPAYLMQLRFDEPPRRDLTINNTLLSLTMILLFSAIKFYASDPHINIVFMLIDGCPSVCVHFKSYAGRYLKSPLVQYIRFFYERNFGYFYTDAGEAIANEAEKIPGIRHTVKSNPLLSIGDHTLAVFSPVRRNWSTYINRSPIFRLPDSFYEDIEIDDPPFEK